jgi:dihydrofolate synthase/folylpolyglutamate synthase
VTTSHVDVANQGAEQAYQEALSFLYDRINYERMASGSARYPFRLQRIRELLERLGLQRYLHQSGLRPAVPLVHIAGTKGKGSVAALVAAGLSESGLKTGLYTSPHLSHLEERFRVDSACCRRVDVVALVDRLRDAVDQLDLRRGPPPSFFELTTAMALMHFEASRCDAIVLEVGLGGRLDSTNVCHPSVTAITSIGLDHQHVLGDTLEQIATEKAGIIKDGVPVVSGVTSAPAADVIRHVSGEHRSPLYEIDRDFSFRHFPDPDWGSRVIYHNRSEQSPGGRTLRLELDGEHQAHNAAVALACLDVLGEQGVPVSADAVARGFGKLRCAGRIERFLMPQEAIAIVDAAHNEDSIAALCRCLSRRCQGRRVTVVFGTSRDKSAAPMLAALATVADQFVLTQYQGNPRYVPTEALLPLVPEPMLTRVAVVRNPIEACRTGLQQSTPGGALVVCGSFFLVAETRDWIASEVRN